MNSLRTVSTDVRDGEMALALVWDRVLLDSLYHGEIPSSDPTLLTRPKMPDTLALRCELEPIEAAEAVLEKCSQWSAGWKVQDDSDDDDDRAGPKQFIFRQPSSYCIKETLSAADAWYCRCCKEHKEAIRNWSC